MKNDNYNMSVLVDTINKSGFSLSEIQIHQFLDYYEFLTEKNQVMNLTAITEYHEVILKHFADSLSIINIYDPANCRSMIDVGTGAGLPGIPLKIVYPHLKVVLLDSLGKRVKFLNELIDRLHLTDIQAIHARAEDAARKAEYREQFDLCVSRAVANLSVLSEYCLPFVKKGGSFIPYKSVNIEDEIRNSVRALRLLGGQLKKQKQFLLPDSDVERCLLQIVKTGTTPAKYPRKAGLPSKEPL